MNIEERIFAGLISDEDYTRKVIPHLKHEYFHDRVDYQLFNLIEHYIQKYNRVPSKEALLVDLGNAVGLTDDEFKGAETKLKGLSKVIKDETAWLVDTTEKFCQDKALFNSLREAIKVMDGKGDQISKTGIPNLLQEALAISFDDAIGHDYIEDSDSRYEFYHRREERLPFDIEYLNKVTKGGLPRRTLSFILAASGIGKSLIMCHMATANLLAGKNVLYITLELAEERIGERIDANLLNVTLDELYELPKSTFEKRITAIKDKTPGKLIIKEYPTSGAGSANFRFLLQELRMKKNFIPDIIYIDYLNICISSRIKQGANVNSYTYIKSIAEELRGLAVEFNVPIVSATQTNRSGFNNSDIDATNMSESMGTVMTADVVWAVMQTEELAEQNQFLFKQLKNRFSDIGKYSKFIVGVDKSKMRIFDAEESAQDDVDKGLLASNQDPDKGKDFTMFK